jgi:MFS family permease
MRGTSGFASILRALENRNYAIYTAGNSFSLVGSWVQRVAVFWLAWQLTESTFWLGAIAFAELFPVVIFAPIAGAAADRWDRLRASRISSALLMVHALALGVLTALGWMTIELLLALMLVEGLVIAFNQPNRLALVPNLVPRESLATAIAFNAVIFNAARFIGPTIAGAIIVAGGMAIAFLVNAVSYLVFVHALSRLRLDGTRVAWMGESGLLREAWGGLRYVLDHRGIGPMLAFFGVGSLLCRPISEMFAGFAAEVFGGGADYLAAMTSAMGLGALLGAFYLAGRESITGLTRLVLLHGMASAAALLMFTATRWFSLGLVALTLTGFTMIVSAIGTQTLLQLAVPAAMRGRVLSIHGMLFRGGPAIGALVIGAASEVPGLRLPTAIAAGLTIVAGLWVWRARAGLAAAMEGEPPASQHGEGHQRDREER